MTQETLNLVIRTGGVVALLSFSIFLIKLAIKYWPKDDLEIKHIKGSSIKYSKNFGLCQTIFHVIGWVFRCAKINSLEIMKALNKASETKSSNMEKDKIKKLPQEKLNKVEEIDTQ